MNPGSSWRPATPGAAFVPVQTRRAFTKTNSSFSSTSSSTRPKSSAKSSTPLPATTAASASPSSPSPSNPPAKKIEWPPAVREYVQRSFVSQNSIEGISRGDMEVKLKQVITSAADNGTLHAVDWATMPLPHELLRDERAKIQAQTHQHGHYRHQPVHFQIDDPKKKRGKQTTAGVEEATDEKPMQKTDSMDPSSTSPWKKANIRSSNDDAKRRRVVDAPPRVSSPGGGLGEANNKKSKSSALASNGEKVKKTTLEFRKRRFENTMSPYAPSSDGGGAGVSDTYNRTPPASAHRKGAIVGRCQNLEKNYFRLTSAPNPDAVRPVSVLKKTLELLKKKWRSENNYGYVCDQFKSLRQDLTVQHVRTEFTTTVYEIHARIALEKGDLGEYNQCQTQLRALYKAGLGGHPREFLAYRILYFIYTRNWTAITDTLAELGDGDAKDAAVRHALEVRKTLARGNYHRFFQLYLDTPNMGAYLMDMFVDRERLAALATICRAYKPDVRIRFITEELGFESDEQSARFILDHSGGHLLQQVEDEVRFLTGKAGLAFDQARAQAQVVDIKGQI